MAMKIFEVLIVRSGNGNKLEIMQTMMELFIWWEWTNVLRFWFMQNIRLMHWTFRVLVDTCVGPRCIRWPLSLSLTKLNFSWPEPIHAGEALWILWHHWSLYLHHDNGCQVSGGLNLPLCHCSPFSHYNWEGKCFDTQLHCLQTVSVSSLSLSLRLSSTVILEDESRNTSSSDAQHAWINEKKNVFRFLFMRIIPVEWVTCCRDH